jgi:hypothetical protein
MGWTCRRLFLSRSRRRASVSTTEIPTWLASEAACIWFVLSEIHCSSVSSVGLTALGWSGLLRCLHPNLLHGTSPCPDLHDLNYHNILLVYKFSSNVVIAKRPLKLQQELAVVTKLLIQARLDKNNNPAKQNKRLRTSTQYEQKTPIIRRNKGFQLIFVTI